MEATVELLVEAGWPREHAEAAAGRITAAAARGGQRKHGTAWAYSYHRRLGEQACEACKAAKRRYVARRRAGR